MNNGRQAHNFREFIEKLGGNIIMPSESMHSPGVARAMIEGYFERLDVNSGMTDDGRYPGAARNFIDAYANTNYLRPLKGEDLDRFYADRGQYSEMQTLIGELEASAVSNPPSNTKFLFVGHTGCGKSTELSRLVNLVNSPDGGTVLYDHYLPVPYSISEVVGLHNIEFVDIALSIVLGIYREMEALGHAIDDAPVKRVYDWLFQEEEGTESKTRTMGGGIGLDVGLGSIIRLIDVRLKSEGVVREEIRTRIRKYIPELITLINQAIDEISRLTGKHILLIIDDLDKIQPLENALRVFREHSRSLAAFNCFVIYTAPISLLYDAASSYASQTMEIRYMPMFRVHNRDGECEAHDARDIATLREIITRRLHPSLFEDGVVDRLIHMTGGVLRELIRVIRGCSIYCQEYELGKITHTALDLQKGRLKGEYYRMLDHEDYRQLRDVAQTKSRADVNMRHLESLCVLYYPDGGKGWFDLHPIVYELLNEWEKEALPADVQGKG
jgi:hypothetical protein